MITQTGRYFFVETDDRDRYMGIAWAF